MIASTTELSRVQEVESLSAWISAVNGSEEELPHRVPEQPVEGPTGPAVVATGPAVVATGPAVVIPGPAVVAPGPAVAGGATVGPKTQFTFAAQSQALSDWLHKVPEAQVLA